MIIFSWHKSLKSWSSFERIMIYLRYWSCNYFRTPYRKWSISMSIHMSGWILYKGTKQVKNVVLHIHYRVEYHKPQSEILVYLLYIIYVRYRQYNLSVSKHIRRQLRKTQSDHLLTCSTSFMWTAMAIKYFDFIDHCFPTSWRRLISHLVFPVIMMKKALILGGMANWPSLSVLNLNFWT